MCFKRVSCNKIYMKYRIDNILEYQKHRGGGKYGETVRHISSQCIPLTYNAYKRRHGNSTNLVHWAFTSRFELHRVKHWQNSNIDAIIGNDNTQDSIVSYD